MSSASEPYGGPGVMVFRPTMQEFQDFSSYIRKMEDCGAHKFGIAKVIPPTEWYATKKYDMEKIGKIVIDSPIAQLVTGQQGLYQQFNIQQKPLTVGELKDMAESEKYCPPEGDFQKIERAYWKNITFNPPIYGADVAGTIYDKDVKCWNINNLNTILNLIESERNVKILGVNTAYLYFGMWKTSFAWHTEDMDLYSINYLHFGASKSWYAIPPEHGKRLETLAAGFFPGSAQTCSQFLRHKMTVISPLILKKYSIPVYKMTQHEGEFMITFPYGYHAGFNQGFNCAESTNFASLRWIDFGKKAKSCSCKRDNVKIEMEIFVRKYQPDQYDEYMASMEKKKVSSNEQNEDDKKSVGKKPQKKLKVKRYPAISTVKSIVKQVAKEARESPLPPDFKKQKQQAIKKAKDLLKKAERQRRETTERMLKHESSRSGNTDDLNLTRTNSIKNHSTAKKMESAESSEMQHPIVLSSQLQDSDDGKLRERERKLLEIKAEMEREIELRKECMQINKRIIRRNKIQESQQKLPKIESQNRKSLIKKETMQKSSTSSSEKKRSNSSTINKISWLSTVNGLWIDQVPDFACEISYNCYISRNGRGCAICAYFDYQLAQKMSEFQKAPSTLPDPADSGVDTVRRVPEVSFMRPQQEHCAGQLGINSTNQPILSTNMQQENSLITCSSCHITVHESCYGVDAGVFEDKSWQCDRCSGILEPHFKEAIRCEICALRGGALKPTANGRWAHIVCAIAFMDITFTNTKRRGLVNLSSLNAARMKLKCIYCQRSSNDTVNNGACVQCVSGKCAHSFHVTCSFQNGIPLYSGDWPVPVEAYCHQHVKARSFKGEKRPLTEIREKDVVFAKHKNGRFYRGQVNSIKTNVFYHVVFEDGSFCHDLPAEDFVGYQTGVIYSERQKADVLWTDGIIYPSVIMNHEVVIKYEVVFEDSSVLFLKRNDIYKADEELPKKIQTKLSCATETANLLWQAVIVNETPKKRARVEKKEFTTIS